MKRKAVNEKRFNPNFQVFIFDGNVAVGVYALFSAIRSVGGDFPQHAAARLQQCSRHHQDLLPGDDCGRASVLDGEGRASAGSSYVLRGAVTFFLAVDDGDVLKGQVIWHRLDAIDIKGMDSCSVVLVIEENVIRGTAFP